MSSAAAALTPATPAKSPKKRAKSQKKKKTGPTVSDLILKAVSASTERGGVSLAAVKKTLKAGGYDVVKNKSRVITAIKRLVINTSLVQTKGTGASGSFKLNKKTPTPRKKKVVKKKKPKAKKVKRTSVKKTAGGASPAAKKSPKKKSKAKSPKKAKKPKRSVPRCTRTRAAAKK